MATMKTDISDIPDMSALCPSASSVPTPDRTGHIPKGVSVCPDPMTDRVGGNVGRSLKLGSVATGDARKARIAACQRERRRRRKRIDYYVSLDAALIIDFVNERPSDRSILFLTAREQSGLPVMGVDASSILNRIICEWADFQRKGKTFQRKVIYK